jgi:hypothetical protein
MPSSSAGIAAIGFATGFRSTVEIRCGRALRRFQRLKRTRSHRDTHHRASVCQSPTDAVQEVIAPERAGEAVTCYNAGRSAP